MLYPATRFELKALWCDHRFEIKWSCMIIAQWEITCVKCDWSEIDHHNDISNADITVNRKRNCRV